MIMKFENGIYVMYGETNYTVAHVGNSKNCFEGRGGALYTGQVRIVRTVNC